MGQTTNYGLKQWENWETVKRGEVNELVGGIDTALAGLETDKAEVSILSYVGNGAVSQTITLGFQPTAVLVERSNGGRYSGPGGFTGGLAIPGGDGAIAQYPGALTILETGFRVFEDDDTMRHTNISGQTYYALALH